MVRGEDGKWRTMANEKLYASRMLIGAMYRSELARELETLGYRVEKTHVDRRFEIEAAMEARGLGDPSASPCLAPVLRLGQRRGLGTAAVRARARTPILRLSPRP